MQGRYSRDESVAFLVLYPPIIISLSISVKAYTLHLPANRYLCPTHFGFEY